MIQYTIQRKYEEYNIGNGEMDFGGPSKQMRRLNNYKHGNGMKSKHDSLSQNSSISNENLVGKENRNANANGNRMNRNGKDEIRIDSENEDDDLLYQNGKQKNIKNNKENYSANSNICLDANGNMRFAQLHNNNNNSNNVKNGNVSRKSNYMSKNSSVIDHNNNHSHNHNHNHNHSGKNPFVITRSRVTEWDAKEIDNELWPTDYIDNIVIHLRYAWRCFFFLLLVCLC